MASVPALTSALLWRLSAAVAAATAKPLGSGLRLAGLKGKVLGLRILGFGLTCLKGGLYGLYRDCIGFRV